MEFRQEYTKMRDSLTSVAGSDAQMLRGSLLPTISDSSRDTAGAALLGPHPQNPVCLMTTYQQRADFAMRVHVQAA